MVECSTKSWIEASSVLVPLVVLSCLACYRHPLLVQGLSVLAFVCMSFYHLAPRVGVENEFRPILTIMKTYVNLVCHLCNENFNREIRQTHKNHENSFCSKKCLHAHTKQKVTLNCSNCQAPIEKLPSQIKKSKNSNMFCNSSCAAKYNNANKTHGTRRSKLESWLETELIKLYPNLEIHFNRKDAINSELDIYIPSIKLAFELNGIFHYEPIFGVDKLESIQNNDQRKFQACIENSIELCIIDASSMKNFKEKKAARFLSIINRIIQQKLSQ